MRVTTYGRYGVRAMVDLAMYRNIGPISLKTISCRQGISVDYLEQILGKLRRNGLVKSVRGPRGGFVLMKEPAKIRVSDILSAVDESYTPVNCRKMKKNKECPRIDRCIGFILWSRLGETIKDFLDGIILDDLCKESRERWGMDYPDHLYMYHL